MTSANPWPTPLAGGMASMAANPTRRRRKRSTREKLREQRGDGIKWRRSPRGSACRLTGLSVGDLMRAQRNGGRSSPWGASPGGSPTSAHSPLGARAHVPIADSPLRERRGARRSRCGAEVRIRTPRGEAPSPAAGRLRSRERARPSRLDLRRRASPGGPAHSPSPRAPPMGAGVNGEEAER